MRVEASITSVSWIPSEAMSGPLRVPLDLGIGRYDDPPPDTLDDLAAPDQLCLHRRRGGLRVSFAGCLGPTPSTYPGIFHAFPTEAWADARSVGRAV